MVPDDLGPGNRRENPHAVELGAYQQWRHGGAAIAEQDIGRADRDAEAVSTGFRVADAKDDGAAYAVAERVRGEIAGTASANEQLGGVKGLLDVTNASLSNVSDTLKKLKTIVVKLADQTITADQQAQYQSQAKELTNNIQAFIQDAGYNGKNILDESVSTLANTVVRNGSGTAYSFNGFSAVTNVFNGVSAANAWTAGSAAAALTAGGALTTAMSNTLTQLNNFRQLLELHRQPDQLQQVEDGCAGRRPRRAGRCRPRQGNPPSCSRCRSVSSWAPRRCRSPTRRRRRC